MKIYIQRHAEAGEFIPNDDAAERSRPLTDEGRLQAWWTGLVLREQGIEPSVMIASPFERTAETAAIVAGILRIPLWFAPELEPNLPIDGFLAQLMADDDYDGLYVVGHHDNIAPAIASLNGVYSSNLAEWHKGEVKKFKVKGGKPQEKWSLKPGSPDDMTVSVGSEYKR